MVSYAESWHGPHAAIGRPENGETMKKNKDLAGRSKSGFTLIELLVVVLIIGILAAIAVPQYFKVVEKGKASEGLATLDSLRSAQERYLAATGSYCGVAGFCAGTAGWDLTIPSMKYLGLRTPGVIAGH